MLNELPHLCREMSFEISDELVYVAYLAGYASVIANMETYMNKVPMHTNIQTKYEWVQYILHGIERKCHNVFRVSRHVFGELCNTLRTQYGYEGSKRVFLEESVAITLVVLGNDMCNRML